MISTNTSCPHCGALLPNSTGRFCPECRQSLDEPSPARPPTEPDAPAALPASATEEPISAGTRKVIDRLEDRVAYLEQRLQQSSLYSPSFLTRAFTAFGHFLVAYLLTAVGVWLVAILAALVLNVVSPPR